MRIMGHNAIAIVLATVAFFILGGLWYGIVFADAWMVEAGYTADDFADQSPSWMGLGVVVSLLTAIGLSTVLRWGGLPDLMGAVKKTLWIWLGFGLTSALYTLAYEPHHSTLLYLIDAGYLLIGWCVMAAIIAIFK